MTNTLTRGLMALEDEEHAQAERLLTEAVDQLFKAYGPETAPRRAALRLIELLTEGRQADGSQIAVTSEIIEHTGLLLHSLRHASPPVPSSRLRTVVDRAEEAESYFMPGLEALRTGGAPYGYVLYTAESGQYIQFMCSQSRPLVMEIPFGTLRGLRLSRVAEVLERHQYEVVWGEEQLIIDVRDNLRDAARIASRVFVDLFGLSLPLDLTITSNMSNALSPRALEWKALG